MSVRQSTARAATLVVLTACGVPPAAAQTPAPVRPVVVGAAVTTPMQVVAPANYKKTDDRTILDIGGSAGVMVVPSRSRVRLLAEVDFQPATTVYQLADLADRATWDVSVKNWSMYQMVGVHMGSDRRAGPVISIGFGEVFRRYQVVTNSRFVVPPTTSTVSGSAIEPAIVGGIDVPLGTSHRGAWFRLRLAGARDRTHAMNLGVRIIPGVLVRF